MDHQFDIAQRSGKSSEKNIHNREGIYLQDNRAIQRKNNTGLPDDLKSGIEDLSGLSMDDVRVHYNSFQPAQLNAHAYAQGSNIHIAPGQEKHLPHEAWHVVQQKQGRVKATMQLKGKINVNDDKVLEHEADTMGAKAMQAKNTAIITSAHVDAPVKVVQRAMGMEIEIPHPIFTASGEIYKGDTLIADHPDFKIVSDYRLGVVDGKETMYSNIEFVMKHFDQLSGSDDEAITELDKRLNAMKEIFVRVDKAEAGTFESFHPHARADGLTFTPNAERSIVGRNAGRVIHGKEPDNLFVHYTIGLRLEDIHDFSTAALSTAKNRSPATRSHAHKSLAVADNVATLLQKKAIVSDIELQKLKGFISLVYMHIGAFYDDVQDGGAGQVKNKTAALSRVPLGTIFHEALPGHLKDLIKANFKAIDQLIADPFPNWNDKHRRRVNKDMPYISTGDYMKSAFGMAAAIPQTLVFGGMHETDIDRHRAGDLIPVEIRTFGKHYVNWDELREDALGLLRYSRGRQTR